MKMYSRDELMNNMNNLGNEDAEDDDSDDEDNFPGKLVQNKHGFSNFTEVFLTEFDLNSSSVFQGNILREKESSKKDIKQKIIQGVKDAGTAVKGHVNRVSKKISSWWRGTKTGTKTSKKGKSEL